MSNKKVRCPKCGKRFDNDDVDRYVGGTIINAAKLAGCIGLKLLGGSIGSIIPGLQQHGSFAGGQLAKQLGLAELDGWQHTCPHCGHKWE